MTSFSEVAAMLALWNAEGRADARGALATVVYVKGSAYRHPGARMLVVPSGKSAGMISGGCLEDDVREHALQVMTTGEPQLVTYDSTAPEDVVFGLGLGCNGVVQILIEPVPQPGEGDLLTFLAVCHDRRQSGSVVTVFSAEGTTAASAGERVLLWPDGNITSTVADPTVRQALLEEVAAVPGRRAAIRRLCLSGGGRLGLLIESIAPPTPLVIFGAGDDAQPLARLAKQIGWHVTVVDARSRYATRERFPGADAVLCARPETLREDPQFALTPQTLVMIMTHSFLRDKELLRMILPRKCRYVGALGPRSRTTRLLEELADEGLHFADESLAALHGPAGLDISAETPEEIAISIIAEMRAVIGQRSGGPLRLRTGRIHEPSEEPVPVI